MRPLQLLHISPQPRTEEEGKCVKGIRPIHNLLFDRFGYEDSELRIKTVFPEDGIPQTCTYDVLLVSGSPLSVYDNIPWKQTLVRFIQGAIDRGRPVLGICFGHQLIAQMCGGRVEKGNLGPEYGIISVTLTKEGQHDPLFEDIDVTFPIASVHGDTVVSAPPGAIELARSPMYPSQSFAIGSHVRTVQFHPEYDGALLQKYQELTGSAEEKERSLVSTSKDEIVKKTGRTILRNFIEHFVRPLHVIPRTLSVAREGA